MKKKNFPTLSPARCRVGGTPRLLRCAGESGCHTIMEGVRRTWNSEGMTIEGRGKLTHKKSHID